REVTVATASTGWPSTVNSQRTDLPTSASRSSGQVTPLAVMPCSVSLPLIADATSSLGTVLEHPASAAPSVTARPTVARLLRIFIVPHPSRAAPRRPAVRSLGDHEVGVTRFLRPVAHVSSTVPPYVCPPTVGADGSRTRPAADRAV